MQQGWLRTSTGVNAFAAWLVAIMLSLVPLTIQDFWIFFTGKLVALHGLWSFWYLVWAALAAGFAAMTVFVWRPGLPRIVFALFSISMASHVLEHFVVLPTQQLQLVALYRIFVAVVLILLILGSTATSHSS